MLKDLASYVLTMDAIMALRKDVSVTWAIEQRECRTTNSTLKHSRHASPSLLLKEI